MRGTYLVEFEILKIPDVLPTGAGNASVPAMRSLQKFASVHAPVTNHFDQERSLSSRPLFKANRAAALAEWRGLCVA